MDVNKTRRVLFLINASLTASLFLLLVVLRYGGQSRNSVVAVILYILPFLFFLLSAAALPVVTFCAVRVGNVSKMEGWWWLSAPYSVAYPCSVFTLHLQEFGHALELFMPLYLVSLLSSFIWLVVIIGLLIISPATVQVTIRQRAVMTAVVIFSVILLLLMLESAQ
jgi:hypothetical protein